MRFVPCPLLAVCLVAFALIPGGAGAQALPPDPAEGAQMQVGPFAFRPTLTLSNIGTDSNVFNEAENPKQDFTATISPVLQVIARGGPARLSYTARLDYVWFQTYSSERSANARSDGRFELRFTRLVPFVAAGLIDTRDRPNAEIDVRADRRETHVAAGAALVIGPTAVAAITVRRQQTDFASDEVFAGVSLERQLDETLRAGDAELRLELTPLTTFSMKGSWEQQEFAFSPERDSHSIILRPALEFNPSALISGTLMVGFRAFETSDPLLPDFNGTIAQIDLGYVLGGTTRVQGRVTRDVHYSYEPQHPYYVSLGWQATLMQQISGPFDVQVTGGRQRLDYEARGAGDARTMTVDTYGGGAGVRIGDQSRVGLSVEISRRRGGEGLTGRDYDRNRVFGSFSYGF